ncbi:hypothetical protein [Embleya sp. AB8]|uniref:hypothetical protein n=1 Tax=Embleya sp. AB8 TaxID=3156304 RepID=UPI003C735C76
MSRAPGPSNLYADYTPAPAMAEAIAAWERSVEEELRLRNAARKAVADELKASGVSHQAVAKFVPWTEATVAGIAKEYGVPPKRKRKADNG